MIGNYLDLVIIFYLLISFLGGIRKKNSDLLLALFSVLMGLGLAFLTFRFTAQLIGSNFQVAIAYANVVGFFLNTVIFKILLALIFGKLLEKTGVNTESANLFNRRLTGALLSLVYGLVTIFVMFSIFMSLTLPGFMTAQLEGSRFGSFIKSDPLKVNGRFEEVFGELLKTALNDFSFLTIKTGTEEKVDLGFKALEVTEDAQAEEKMLVMVNNERTMRGLNSLTMNEEARRAARDYGKYLFKNGIFSHTDLEGKGPADRLKNYDITFTMAGENLAYAPGLEEAHQGLMDSKGHRENILHPFFSRVGIGVIDGGSYGMIFVQEFLD